MPPEFNPADETQPTKEEWEAFENSGTEAKPPAPVGPNCPNGCETAAGGPVQMKPRSAVWMCPDCGWCEAR